MGGIRRGIQVLKSRIDLFQLFFCPVAEFPVVGEAVGVPHLHQIAIAIVNLTPGSAALKAKCPKGTASSAPFAGRANRSAAFTQSHAPSIPPGKRRVNANRASAHQVAHSAARSYFSALN
jgi:hypothetical protein